MMIFYCYLHLTTVHLQSQRGMKLLFHVSLIGILIYNTDEHHIHIQSTNLLMIILCESPLKVFFCHQTDAHIY